MIDETAAVVKTTSSEAPGPFDNSGDADRRYGDNRRHIVHEDEIEKAFHWVRENTTEAAQAEANLDYMEEWCKIVLAEEMAAHSSEPLGFQAREARRSAAYKKAILAKRDAVKAVHYFRMHRKNFEAMLSAFQTQSANERVKI